MKSIASYLLLCVLCLAVLGSASAASPETDSSDWPDVPFARRIETGEIIYLGMDKAEAEAIAGAPLEEAEIRRDRFSFGKNLYVCDGITLAFRDDRVVFIEIPYEDPYWANDELTPAKDPRWAANGVVMPFMPTDQALEALGMTSEEVNPPYRLIYFEDGTRAQFDRNMFEKGYMEYPWEITLHGDSQTIGAIWMGDKQYITMFR
ncbi:MAG: hypothetical protein FWG03_10905 [Clostridiales bacterium]|nr:hypothetical protein [Clostridiales bacterium]